MSRTTFNDTFSSFIDHYILLLAARFKAPLDVVLEDGAASYGCTVAEAYSRWELVSQCVQDELHHPRTVEERQNVKHLDVSFFTGDVCRERALYLQWKMHSDGAATRETTASAAATTQGHQGSAQPSTFDVTRNSLSERVSAIFADVRNHLPSALVGLEDDDDDDGDDAMEDAVAQSSHAVNGAHHSGTQPVAVREVFVPTEEERMRDMVLAKARDNLLTQVQALQAKFYEQHRRWIEVPFDSLELKPHVGAEQAAPVATSGAAVTKRQSEELERAELLAALRGDAQRAERNGVSSATHPSALEQLRQSVHVNRPARPSEMSEDAIVAMYSNAVAKPAPEVPVRGSRITKETAAPAGRHQRWQIMEYEDEPADASDDDDDDE